MSDPIPNSLFDLHGRTIIVTGASGNIGCAIAQMLARHGANLLLHYHRRSGTVDVLMQQADRYRGRLVSIQADLSEPAAAEAIASRAINEFGSIYGLVNNAGIQPTADFQDISAEEFDLMIRTNLTAAFSLTQSCARTWTDDQVSRSVVNIASIEGVQPAIGHSHYSISKAAITMLSKSSAIELGKLQARVNTISPGSIEYEGIRNDWPEHVKRWENAAALGCLGSPDDVASATLFLMSDASKWISGTNLVVDGGMLAGPNW